MSIPARITIPWPLRRAASPGAGSGAGRRGAGGRRLGNGEAKVQRPAITWATWRVTIRPSSESLSSVSGSEAA